MPVGGTPPQDGVERRDRALSDAIATEAGALPGVQQADVRITGRPAHPRTYITLTPQRTPDAVLNALCEVPLHTCKAGVGGPAPRERMAFL
jgi:hypothetical protein